jgi:hypothetical protein
MAVGRRELMLGALGMGLALAAGPRPARAEEGEIPQPFSTYGLVPGDGIDQTASLQEAADKAAESGTPFFLLPGNYMSGKLELKSGTQIQGVPGKSVLRCNGGGAVISIEKASDIRLTGLTLEGKAKPIDSGALLIAKSVKGLNRTAASSAVPSMALCCARCQAALQTARSAASAEAVCSARTQPASRSRIIMCAIAAITASWYGARKRERTPPS